MPVNEPSAPHRLTLRLLSNTLAVCYLPAGAPIPDWAVESVFHAITRTPHELSIVCDQSTVPPDVEHEGPWRCLEVEGPLDFVLTGILSSLAAPLASAGIPIFALSTYRTDYLLVPASRLDEAINSLRAHGHSIDEGQKDQR